MTHPESERYLLQFHIPCYMKDVNSREYCSRLRLCNRAILHSLTLIIDDMKRTYRKVFKLRRPSLDDYVPATSTSTLMTSTSDPMPSILATSSDTTTNAEVTAGFSVSVQLYPLHFLSIKLLLSSRPLIMLESLLRFTVIFLL